MRTRSVGIVVLALIGAVALMATGTVGAQESRTYEVTIENLTDGQPFTPPVVVAHSGDMDIFETGEAASEEVRQIAENGNNDPLVGVLSGSSAVSDYATGDGPVLPGESMTLTIDAPAGDLLSVVFMLICTNDGFSGVDSWELPASGSQTVDANAYDAGTEMNTEDFADIVPPCQDAIGVSSDDEGTGESNPDLAEGGVITMHAGIQGGDDLTVDDHGWTDPVARITVSTSDAGDDMALPSSGTGFAGGSNGTGQWLVYLGVVGVALVAFGGALSLARRRNLN